MSFSLEETVRQGVARMGKRRRVMTEISHLAGRDPERAVRGLIVLATRERDRLHAELQASFGFSIIRDPRGFRCRFTSPGRCPRTPEEKAAWLGTGAARGLRASSRPDVWGEGNHFSFGRRGAKRGRL